jgi:hypothetical protein
MPHYKRFTRSFLTAAMLVGASGIGVAATLGSGTTAAAAKSAAPAAGCNLGNGVKHVVSLVFDNVHFNRDNPNVPSDLELMPHLLGWLERYGVVLSNNHTPLIAHTAVDSLTTYTGLYGDRQGMPISNSYQAYNADGTTDPASSFTYWTDPIFDTLAHPSPGHDTNPSMVYSAVPPATASSPVTPNTVTPAPWVPFTRAGCTVGDVSTANMVLENPTFDIPEVFGSTSPEAQQLAADPAPFKDAETADYVGLGVHCAQGATFCSSASGVKFGQTSPSPTAVADILPDEPGGYTGFQALFGHRYISPQLGAGTPDVTHNGYEVTNSSGNLVDLFGNQINGAFVGNTPGFPGFSNINAAQTLAYMADLQETGVPVTYGYISDIHGNEHIPALSACVHAPSALGSGSACYIAQAQYYDAAFATFFQRLLADGISPQNTVFVVSPDEGDHEAGGNVGRSATATPPNCDGATVAGGSVVPDVLCTYPSGSFGELAGNMKGLIVTETGDTTPYSLEADSAPEFYVTGNPPADSPAVRNLERHVASLIANNPYVGSSGNDSQLITNYLADRTEEAILHIVNADPARTPTFALFAKPDYFFFNGAPTCTSSCVSQSTGFAWDHGDYAAEINNNWVAFVGPTVTARGVDGSGPADGPSSAGADSGQENLIQQAAANPGTWVDETDIQPTMLYLAGLRDDYVPDGRVISQILTEPPRTLSDPFTQRLAACYKQLNSSVGEFGTWTLEAATTAIESNSSGDSNYLATDSALFALEQQRDQLAGTIKTELFAAEFDHAPIPASTARDQTVACEFLLSQAHALASGFTLAPVVSASASSRSGLTAARARAVTERVSAWFGSR